MNNELLNAFERQLKHAIPITNDMLNTTYIDGSLVSVGDIVLYAFVRKTINNIHSNEMVLLNKNHFKMIKLDTTDGDRTQLLIPTVILKRNKNKSRKL